MPELQPYKNIYRSLDKFISSLKLDNWVILYILFEINLIKELGYDTNLTSYHNKNDSLYDFKKVKIDEYTYEVPNFLIQQKIPNELKKNFIKKSLAFTRNVFLNKFFTQNNLVFPKSRVIFENYYS